jgi:hypothetical protein
MRRVPDCTVEASCPTRFTEDVPYPNAARMQEFDLIGIEHVGKSRFAEYPAQESPECVRWVRIVFRQGKRSLTRQCSKQKYTHTSADNRWKGGFDAPYPFRGFSVRKLAIRSATSAARDSRAK